MQFGPVKWPAIALSVIATFAIGGLWYSPLLFVKPWLKMSGVDKKVFDAGLPKALVVDLFAATVTAIVLNQIIRWSGAIGLGPALLVSLVVASGFVASVLVTQVTYEQRPFAFFAISLGYRFVTFLAMGMILGAWR